METERQLVNGGALRSFLGKQVQIYLKVDRLTPGGQQVRFHQFHEILQFANFVAVNFAVHWHIIRPEDNHSQHGCGIESAVERLD